MCYITAYIITAIVIFIITIIIVAPFFIYISSRKQNSAETAGKKGVSPVATFPDVVALLMEDNGGYPERIVVINGKDFTAVPSTLDPVSGFGEKQNLHDC